MKDIILAGNNAHTTKTYKQIGECLENAPDLNHSGKPIVHIIGDKATLDKVLDDNVIDTVIFVSASIPVSEESRQELIPIDAELLDELTKKHPNSSFITIVRELEKSSQKLLRLYMHEHYNIIYRENLAQSVSSLVKLIRTDRTKEEAFTYCALEGVPLEEDDRTNIYSPEKYEESEDDIVDDEVVEEDDTIEDVGIAFDDMEETDEEEAAVEVVETVEKPKPKAKRIVEPQPVIEEEEYIPPKKKKVVEEPKQPQIVEEKKEHKKEEPKADIEKKESKSQKAETPSAENKKEKHKLTLSATALEMLRLDVVSIDNGQIVLKVPEGHVLSLPANIKDTPSICVLLNKR